MSQEHRHFCAAHCDQTIPRGQLMCKRHWFLVPRMIRDEVTRTWEEFKKHKSAEKLQAYREAAGKAVRFLERAA